MSARDIDPGGVVKIDANLLLLCYHHTILCGLFSISPIFWISLSLYLFVIF